MSFSFSTVFEDVPEETRLWKPETAPQATVTNRMGNIEPREVLKLVKAGKFIVGCATRRPTAAPAIIPMNMNVVM